MKTMTAKRDRVGESREDESSASRSRTGQDHMTLHLEFKNFDAVHTRLALIVDGAQAGEFNHA
jgi:hypothetical protein